MDWTPVVISCITTLAPTLTTILTARSSEKKTQMDAARQSILQLMLEDKVAVMNGEKPENYQAVQTEFDAYTKAGGNHYVASKVARYNEWYENIKIEKKDNVAK